MDGLHNEHEAKVEQDQGTGSAPPGYINELPVCTEMPDLGQQPVQLPPNEAQHALVAEPFQPLIEELKRLVQDDPQFAHQVAQIVRLYRRLYECYIARKSETQRLEQANGELRTANLQLRQESEYLKGRYAEQGDELAYFGQASDKLSTGIGRLLANSGGCCSEPMYEAASKMNEEAP